MIYLDYAANTPADSRVLESFCSVYKNFTANPNSSHMPGKAANEKILEITGELKAIFHKEIIYTSGASEANNLAIKGITGAYRENGKHIITTCLEHPSVSGCLTFLQNQGYEIDLVDINSDGKVSIEHLKELLRQDTVLVSICYVDSELGVIQPIGEIGRIIKEYPGCFFHCDATQAIGKTMVDFCDIDLVTFAPHKFFGLNGSGALLKAEGVTLIPLIHGGGSVSIYRSGTPDLAGIAALKTALEIAFKEFDSRYARVKELNLILREELKKYPLLRFNSPADGSPHILNVSVMGIRAEVFKSALEEYGVCISVKSACSTLKTPSRPVYAVTKDKKNAMCSWRISLSHLTTQKDLDGFLEAFKASYEKLIIK